MNNYYFFGNPDWRDYREERASRGRKKRNDRKNRFQDDMYTVFSPGGKDFMGVKRRPQIIAVFDTMGNGAVFDEEGRTRSVFENNSPPLFGIFNQRRSVPTLSHELCSLVSRISFNQIGGVWKDNPTRIPLTWRWDIFERTPILENVYVVGERNRSPFVNFW